MKKIYLLLFVSFFISMGVIAQQGDKCGTQDWLENQFKANPSLRAQYDRDEKKLGEVIQQRLARRGSNPAEFSPNVTIPIVFHVVLTAAQHAQITDAMILEQLAVLNRDFLGTNPDSANIPPEFQAVRGHATFSFCMAQRTPDGLATNGIVRVVSNTLSTGTSSNTDPVKVSASGGSSSWDPNKYVNVWLCNYTNSTLLGYATFPMGTPENGNPIFAMQGVTVRAQTIPGGTAAPYNGGRTLTHELGHFFWLRHITGDATCGNDFPNTPGIDDTPQQNNLTGGCPGMAPNVVTQTAGCTASPNPPGRMYQNFMDYTDDRCMTMYTNGQIIRAEASITTYRASLLTSDGCLPPSGFGFTAGATATAPCPSPATVAASLATTAAGGFNTPIVLTATSGVPAGTTVTFSPNPVTPGSSTFVTLNNANTLPNGTYTVTVQGVAGTSTQTTTVTFVISAGTAPTVTAPGSITVCAGETAGFTVTASVAPVTGYQWQLNTGTGFTNIAGATSASYTTAATTAAMNGYQYRVVATGQCGITTSAAATLTVNTAAAIATQPTTQVVCAGSSATFTVAATGAGLTYQWQLNTGSGFNNIVGATAASHTVNNVALGQSGHQYRVIVTGTCGGSSVTSAAVSLTVGNSAAITGQPSSTAVCVGATATFTGNATGSSLTYQWQVSTNGTTWTNVTTGTGGTTLSYTTPVTTAAMNGYQYRLNVFSCTPTPLVTNVATLTVNTPSAINAQPINAVLCEGSNATFSVTAVGTAIGYQWQSAASCAGPWTNIGGATSASYTVNAVTPAQNGLAYRVIITNVCNTVTSDCATLTVNSPIVVTAQPQNASVCLPTTTASFNVVVTGTAPVYQWQVSTNNGTTWTNVAGATTATLSLTGLTVAMSGNQYRAVISGTCTPTSFNSSVATLAVNSPVAITDQPDDVRICEGSNTSFTVAATGSTITYQWQVRRNGSAFSNVTNAGPYSGATTPTLTLTNATTALNGSEYRVVVSGVPCGSVNSDTASLVVNTLPGVVLVAAQYANLTPYTPSGLYSTVSPAGTYTYVWKKDGAVIANATSASIPVNVDWFGEYDVTVTDVNGCSSTSNKVTVSDSVAVNMIFIYPNPSNGVFDVRYYAGASTDYSVNVYDSRGARVWSRRYPVSAPYQQLQVDLGRNAAGVYKVEVRDRNGKRLAAGNVLIQR